VFDNSLFLDAKPQAARYLFHSMKQMARSESAMAAPFFVIAKAIQNRKEIWIASSGRSSQ
jgi:hypothetical protein